MTVYDSTAVGKVISDLYAQVEEQKKRVLCYVDELVESNDVIEQRDATIAIHRHDD